MKTSVLFQASRVAAAFSLAACASSSGGGTGTAGPASAASAPAAPAIALPADVTEAMVARGRTLFSSGSCARCHGPNGVGSSNGPSLVRGSWLQVTGNYDEIVKLVTEGVPAARIRDRSRQFAMNPRGGPMNLSDADVRSVAAYVYTISRDK